MRSNHRFGKLRRSVRASLLALAALFVVDGLDAPSAFASSDPCTITLSSPGTSAGGSGRDVICGTGGNDTLIGQGGADELRGKGGNDRLFGDSGSDELSGSSGDDELKGGTDNDTLNGGTGRDRSTGDSGNDLLQARDGDIDNVDCAAGHDTADLDLLDVLQFGVRGRRDQVAIVR